MTAADISRALADRVAALAAQLLRGGHREGTEWRAGSLAGEPGHSLGVHLAGSKAGLWCDFATGEAGDALDLVRAVLRLNTGEALAWSRHWLGVDAGAAELPPRPAPKPVAELKPDPERWRRLWSAARPIGGTLAETYLAGRGLKFDDPKGQVLRFAPRRARRAPAGEAIEHHPALLALLCDARTGEPCGIVNIHLRPYGSDRLRDRRGKTITGRARAAVVMLSAFDEPTAGLVLCEGVETGIAVFQSGLRPIWACGGAGTLASFPALGGIEALTIAADADDPGCRAAAAVAVRYRAAGREAAIVPPPVGDWADLV
jgi:putative DNA primase/helicase